MFDAKNFLANTPHAPGVYQMLDAVGTIIYIGKAKDLRKRVSSYFRAQVDQPKTAVLVKQICDIKLIITQSENEALILENNLIKQHRPRYNILFKDDKNYPYLIFSKHTFPRLDLIRTHKTPQGEYFGPYSNSTAVREILQLSEKLFLLRNCADGFFAHRSRPCLQYHIKRCSAPCVGLISVEEYQEDVQHAKLFLQGKNALVIAALTKNMDEAAMRLDFEKAAFYRDQIQHLREIEAEQHVQKGHGDFDIIAAFAQEEHVCVQLFIVRGGKIIGDKFVHANSAASSEEVLEYFIEQHYLNVDAAIPKTIFVSHLLKNDVWLSQALTEQAATHKVHIRPALRGIPLNLMKLASHNAEQALLAKLAHQTSLKKRFESLENILDLPLNSIHRMECFDISHTFGEATVASCVVFDENGPSKKDYRIFNIQNITAGDDFAAMHQVLTRRFRHAKEAGGVIPDLLIIDGGKGQLQQAIDVLQSLEIQQVIILGIAKGPMRKPGLEVIWRAGAEQPVDIDPHSPAMHLLQHIRDEAHRFAITRHRAKRGKSKQTSLLENIEGIGAKRRQALLKHFGGLQGLKNASIADIAKVPGISMALAEKIVEVLR
ncbi:MAG: excinuclease subunit [Gammaproteobacteria bacterium]|jgi:excinuclease ABC subunit C|nr:excinuclease subunit [Gammaproteobacteria bacterium]